MHLDYFSVQWSIALVRFPFEVNTMLGSNLWIKGIILIYNSWQLIVHHGGKTGQELKERSGGRNWGGNEGTLLTGLFHMSCFTSFLSDFYFYKI